MTIEIIIFSEGAAAHIKKMIAKKNALGFRLSVKEAGCTGLKYQPEIVEQPPVNDMEYVASQGFKVFIDPASIKFINGTYIDYLTKGLSQQLTFNNPNVKSECGCGESFHVE